MQPLEPHSPKATGTTSLSPQEEEQARERLYLSEADKLELAHFTALFRELVEMERTKFMLAHPQALAGVPAKVRTTLYPDKIPKPGNDTSFVGALRLGTSTFKIRAWAGAGFINLELALESGARSNPV